jgi:hypothetical protein
MQRQWNRPLGNAWTKHRKQKIDPRGVLLAAVIVLLGLVGFAGRVLQLNDNASKDQPEGTISQADSTAFISQSRMTFRSDLDPSLPKWIRDYIAWHREVRSQYPGSELFTNPNAPNVLIRTCLGLCGGLHDRIGQLPWDLFLANQTRRVLFLRWYRPKPIEDFLAPNAFNWSMPPNIPGFSTLQEVKHSQTELFEGADDSRPEAEFWATHLDKALHRANHGEFKNVKILRHRILGHINEDELEKRLIAAGETDMLHATSSFGKIFFLFFRPVPAIEMELQDIYQTLRISPGQYSAVHCRVRHPKAFSKTVGL